MEQSRQRNRSRLILVIIFRDCKELDLPLKQYDLDSAFQKAQTEWAEEIMVATADYILK